MDLPDHGSGARGESDARVCPRCGHGLPSGAPRCPRCHPVLDGDDAQTIAIDPIAPPGPRSASDDGDDALTIAIDPIPTPGPQSTADDGDDAVTRYVAADDVTIAGSTPAVEDADALTVAATDPRAGAGPRGPGSPAARPPGATAPRRGGGDTGPLEVGQSFGPRYHVIRLLGIGGMGAVYQAWDAELGVAVAIKVIRPEVMADPQMGAEVSRRFKRELLLARQVTHKNVVRIHDLGDIDGIKYITMSYVEGTDLSTILKRDGKQPVAGVLRVARDVIAGLVAAHTAGVVHRDLKPANIMIGADGEALIMDFGIAHSTGEASAPAVRDGTLPEHLRRAAAHHAATTVGSVVGTLEYMAPEQAKGIGIDQRTDIYAFGLILYDALVGHRRAASGESAVQELQRRMAAPPPPVSSLAPHVAAPLAALVGRCIEPDPEKRFQTSADLAAELDRLDDRGELIPIKRVIGLPQMAAVVVLLTALFGGSWWYFREPPVVTRDPVSVLIADFENRTGDPAFDHTLEPMLKRALEEAAFISAYERTGLRDIGVRPPDALGEAAAQELAIKQGLRVVLAGSIEPQPRGYLLSIRARTTVTGEDVTTAEERVASREQVLAAATRLMLRVREDLGDDARAAATQYAAGGLSTTSLDVVRLYSSALQATANNRFDEARDTMTKAVAMDPGFGIGHLFLSVLARNTGRLDEQEQHLKSALSHIGSMTERERYTTRAFSHLVNGDYQACVKELTDQIALYPGVITGRNQLALCKSYLRDMRGAVADMQALVKLVPGQPLYRDNLALFASYAGDFPLAEQEARAVEKDATRPDPYAALAIAFSQLGRGDVAAAEATYQRLAENPRGGASMAASGLGDLAVLQGRFSDGVSLLRKGADDDLASDNRDAAAAKLAAVAHAELSRGQARAAIAAAEAALTHSTAAKIRFLAGRLLIEAGDSARAARVIEGLAKEPYTEPQAYVKILRALVALKRGEAIEAMGLLNEANTAFNTWIGLFDLGRAAFDAGNFTAADSAFDQCVNARRGEALALFVDEEPTYAYLPAAYYFLGRSREQLNDQRFAEPYREYLRLRGSSREDPRLPDVRKRAGSTGA